MKFYESVFPFKLKSKYVDENFDTFSFVDPFSYDDLNSFEYIIETINPDELCVNHQKDGSSVAYPLEEIVTDITQVNNQTSDAHVCSSSKTMLSPSDVIDKSSQSNLLPSLGQLYGGPLDIGGDIVCLSELMIIWLRENKDMELKYY